VELNLCFILSATVIGLPRHPMNLLRIRHLITKNKIDSYFFEERFLQLFHKSNKPHFLGLYWRNKTTWDVGRTLKKLVNLSPDGS